MLMVERHFNKGNPEIIRLCKLSKELYNRCNYLMRKAWFSQQHLKFRQLPDISVLTVEAKDLDCFKHRYDALLMLGAKSLPALVVIDKSMELSSELDQENITS